MKAYEKEILEAQVKNEEWVIRQLKLLYNKASDDINEKIKALKARYEEEGLQSIIYQLDYQKALKTQIKGVLDVLYADEHTKISEYLNICYQEGFLSSMYSINKQGIPLILPMDQEQIINAIVHKSKISEGLYKKLGININDLKKRINVEVSRGIANNFSFSEIARNIKNTSNIDLNKSLRIARTEGHRIQGQAQMDACNKAKEKGADVVKQWDASLDSRTRPSHAMVDGEIRELDEKFSNGLMFPGDPSGKASEVVNCRCAMNQRAKWALDEDELQTLQDRANYYGIDKTENFEDFKKKYLKAVESEKIIEEQIKSKDKLTLDNFPDAFKANAKKTKNAQLLSDYINSQENADPKVVELFSKLNDMENISSNGIDFDVGFGNKNAVTTWRSYSGGMTKAKITLQDLTKNNSLGAYQTNLHETGHLIDLYKRKNIRSGGDWFTNDYKDMIKKASSDMSDEVKTLFETTKKKYLDIEKKIKDSFDTQLSKLTTSYKQGGFSSYDAYSKAWKKLYKERNDIIDIEKRNLGIGMLEDIYDALSGGTYRDSGVIKYGHGSKYYRTYEARINEIFANYMSLSVSRPDLVEMLKRDKPELVGMLDKIVDEMLKGE